METLHTGERDRFPTTTHKQRQLGSVSFNQPSYSQFCVKITKFSLKLKLQTYNLTSNQACSQASPDMTTEKILEREHGKGHVTTTTVPCKLQQWDRYRVPQNVFFF